MRALLGVRDRSGLAEFAAGLAELGVELIATDGTRRTLEAAGVRARSVAELTGFPELLDGRVKTLHPAVHAGILARRDLPDHLRQLAEHGLEPIDIVVVSLYPFETAVASGAAEAELVEMIDIGGPAMIRAAAKNCASVTVVVSPSEYPRVLAELRAAGEVSAGTRRRLAAAAFAHVAAYDTAVAAQLGSWVGGEAALPEALSVGGGRLHQLRYGENPHQSGALYALPGPPGGVARAHLHQGSELSFTNWLDVDAAWAVVGEVAEPAAVIIKHTNPCGFAVGESTVDAYRRAHQCDPRSAFGGIVGLNRSLDGVTAEELARTFLEAVVAPSVEPEAAALLAPRTRLRVLSVDRPAPAGQLDVRSVAGGLLVQTPDHVAADRSVMRVATSREPVEGEWEQLLLAWRLCRHVKSNAIVVVRDGMAVGVGAGQMSRVEAADLAVARAAGRSAGAVAASDAFFPLPDGVETLGRAGIRAVIQPGGSRRDAEVVAAAEALGMTMVLAGERHFRH